MADKPSDDNDRIMIKTVQLIRTIGVGIVALLPVLGLGQGVQLGRDGGEAGGALKQPSAGSVAAAGTKRGREQTAKAHWAKPPIVDFVHVDLDMSVDDVGSGRVVMREQLVMKGIRESTETVELDGPSPKWAKIRSIAASGRKMIFVHRNEQMSIDVDPPLKRGEEMTLSFEYDLNLGGRAGAGLILVKGDDQATPPLSPMLYSQGQAELNHLWFFCHDFPNDRMTSAVTARVPKGLTVISNGVLEGIDEPAGKGLQAWKWKQQQPHAAYLISVAIGAFERVELPSAKGAGVHGKDVPVEAYVEPGKRNVAIERFGETGAMIEFFARQFDEPYPFDKYAQTTVRAFPWGGMENSSATTLTDTAVLADAPADPTLISHELAHQWFGDLVTCRTWEHVWLNEGWATYAESLWNAESARLRGGNVQAALLEGLLHYRDQLSERYAKGEGSKEPLASNVYADPDDTFEKADDPYGKGAWVLHMLHARLGDEAFWRGTREYLNRWKYREVETSDFRRCLEEASGDALDRFFMDWVYRYGMPTVDVNIERVMNRAADEGEIQTRVTILQTNPEGGPRAITVPVILVGKEGRRVIRIETDAERWEGVFSTEFAIERGDVDPDATLLANWSLDKSSIPLNHTCGSWKDSTAAKP